MTKPILIVLLACLLGGCNALKLDKIGLQKGQTGSLLPGGAFKFSPRYSVAYMDIIMVAGLVALVYEVVDPAAPAWEILETRLPDNRVLYKLRMQYLHVGGDGEARYVLARRVETLAREQGLSGYQIQRYEEAVDSRILLPQRTAYAEVQLLAAK